MPDAAFETADVTALDFPPDTVREWLGTPMFFSSYDAGTVARMIQELALKIISQQEEVQMEGARDVAFRWLLARKRGE